MKTKMTLVLIMMESLFFMTLKRDGLVAIK